MRRRATIIALLSVLAGASAIVLGSGLLSSNDPIDIAAQETEEMLSEFESSRDPSQLMANLQTYHGEAAGHQVMISVMGWSLEHRTEFVRLADAIGTLDLAERQRLTERMRFALDDTGMHARFQEAFAATSHPMIDALRH